MWYPLRLTRHPPDQIGQLFGHRFHQPAQHVVIRQKSFLDSFIDVSIKCFKTSSLESTYLIKIKDNKTVTQAQ